ncbi:MAG TPA: DUF899 family protein [Streptosporangiaceae bacterium]
MHGVHQRVRRRAYRPAGSRSAYARGLDHLDFAYGFLDMTALGRQEAWEEPKGRAPDICDTL